MSWPAPAGAPVPAPARGGQHTFTTGQLVRHLVGAEVNAFRACERIINYWRINGAITPSIRFEGGSGRWVAWSRDDLERIERIWALRQQMHDVNMLISVRVVQEIWEALSRGETWSMSIDVNVPDASSSPRELPRAAS